MIRGFALRLKVAAVVLGVAALVGAVAFIASDGFTMTYGYFDYRAIDGNTAIKVRNFSGPGGSVQIPSHMPFGPNFLPVTRIEAGAFSAYGNRRASEDEPRGVLDAVTIPDTVTRIGESAFRSNRLAYVAIPDSVTYIGNNAFRNNPLTYVSVPSHATVAENAFDSGVTVTRRD